MNNLAKNKSTDSSFQTMIVDYLKKDGAICDSGLKEYDVYKTYEGGTADRFNFKSYNDDIIKYHSILKVLTGERRSNIRETIPVIDFANPENTSFLNQYNFKDGDETQIDPTTISSIDVPSKLVKEPSSLSYIEDEDESIVNRALMGYSPQEQFFSNKPGNNPTEFNIQTAEASGEYSYVYKGIKLPSVFTNNEVYEGIREDSILCTQINSTTGAWLIFKPELGYDPGSDSEETDEFGILKPTTNTTFNGINIISAYSRAGNEGWYQIELSLDDIYIVIPESSYSSGSTKILVFKKVMTEGDSAQTGSGEPIYSSYILYVDETNPVENLVTINSLDNLPSYLNSDYLASIYNNYLSTEKEYYGPASGLLNGYFCEPKEYEGTKITKWKFENDVDYAKSKNVSIPIGAKYFEGHILNRGNILDQPLGLTKSDPLYPNGDPEHPYKGKATIIYDKIRESTSNLFKAVQVDKKYWSNFNLKAVTALITKADYSCESLGASSYKDLIGKDRQDNGVDNGFLESKMAYINKLKTPTGTALTSEDIRDYISKCMRFISSDGTTLSLDPVNNIDNISYHYDIIRNSSFLNWGWFTHNAGSGGDGNLIYENLNKIYYVDWNQREKYKGKGIIDAVNNLSVQLASPIDVFNKKNSKNDVLLIYPEYNKYIPNQLIIISRYDLGLEEFNPIIPDSIHTPSRGMCSLYNPVKRKIISFKVSEVIKFLPSKVNKIKLYSPLTRSWHERSCKISGGNSKDCYIYLLSPMELTLTGVDLYDEYDQLIDLNSGSVDLTVMPLSYPNDYFKSTSKVLSDETLQFIVDFAHRATDVNDLNGSYIIPGLPQFNDPEELRNISKDGLKLDIFADLLSTGVESFSNTITKKTIFNILSDWRLSDDKINPIRMSNLSEVLNGLLEFRYYLNDLVNSNISIPVVNVDGSTTYKTISNDDVNYLLTHIETDIDDSKFVCKLETPEDGYDLADTTDPENFTTTIKNRIELSKIKFNTIPSTRQSIRKFKQLFDGIFSPSAVVSRDLCIKLDEFLGNDTKSFLRFGDPASEGDVPESINLVSEKLSDTIETLILDTDKEFKSAERKEDYKKALMQYFTEESVNEALNSKTPSINLPLFGTFQSSNAVNFSKLKFDYERYYTYVEKGTVTADVSKIINLLNIVKNKYATWGGIASKKVWFFNVFYWVNNYWSRFSLKEFVYNYKLGRSANFNFWDMLSNDKQRKDYLENIINQNSINEAKQWIQNIDNEYNSKKSYLTEEVVENYLFGEDNLRAEVINEGTTQTTKFIFNIPSYTSLDDTTDTIKPSGETKEFIVGPYYLDKADVSTDVLKSIADYANYMLKGVSEESYSVKFLEGDDEPSGREESLYFKRYRVLNNRMHWINGPLMQAATLLNNKKVFKSISTYSNNFIKSYEEHMTVVPLPKIETLAYFPTQQATGTTIPMPGKFYYEAELEALRQQIDGKCILTCNRCSIKDSCPFYNEEEILKLYCTPAPTLDVWVKDNMLDLISYQSGDDPSPNLSYISADGTESKTISSSTFKTIHKPYADIKVKLDEESTTYSINSLDDIRNKVKKYIPNWEDESRGGFGWMINGRYGTAQKNRLPSKAPKTFKGKNIPNYKLMYDTVFIPDEETEVLYVPSKNKYDVYVTLGEPGAKETYKGTTRIKIPATLKAFAKSKPNDDVYLVSDDVVDSSGNSIIPVIYLNTISRLSYAFDLRDTGNDSEVKSESDFNLYAKDVAQWCINYIKGNCIEDPIDPTANPINQDQYWMNTIKKKVYDDKGNYKWIEVQGRPRIGTGFSDIVSSESSWDSALMVSGRPVAANYENFIRRLHFNMNSILWVKPNSDLVKGSNKIKELNYIDAVEQQRITFTQMKTNLRLVIVHN